LDRRRYLPKGILTFLGVAGLTAAGCGLFDTRDAQPPAQGAAPCRSLLDPNSVVENIRDHYGKPSVSCYVDMLGPAFVFHPDPADSTSYEDPNPFESWVKDIEERVATNIAADSVVSFQVFFDGYYQNPIVETGPPQRETRFYNYHILFTRIGRFLPTRYQGRAEITFEQDAGALYRIVYWRDQTDGSGYQTWGRLRGDHRVGF